MTLKLTFHGAAGTVTGSRHLLTSGDSNILVDCGLFQGMKELRLRNWAPTPFDPADVDHLVLTHIHIDHSGYTPRLVREGFRGPIHATRATKGLSSILWLDAAKIQEEDAAHANRKGWTRHRPALPLFTREDAERAVGRVKGHRYESWFDLPGDVRARFHNMGHILGSAMVETAVGDFDGGATRIVFSGDIGRYDMPLHPDPEPLPACDALVIESTYGDRLHDEEPLMDQLAGPMRSTFDEGGVVLIPAFAVGRSQLITLILCEAMEQGILPEVPIHIDSPMAVDATGVYRKFANDDNLDEDVVDRRDPVTGRIYPKNVRFHRSTDESKELNGMRGPRVIVSSSGMLTGGRVIHHLGHILPNRRNLLVLVGYQAKGTRGRALLDGSKSLKMHGKRVPVKCRFLSAHGLSAHADRDEMIRWVKTAPEPPRRIFVVHGEPESSAAFAETLRAEFGCRVDVPELDQAFDLAET